MLNFWFFKYLVLVICCFVSKNAAASSSIYDLTSLAQAMMDSTFETFQLFTGNLPIPPINYAVEFYCANPNSKKFVRTYHNDSNIQKIFDIRKEVVFITHGWNDFGTCEWMEKTASTWIKYHDVNICKVGWGRFAGYDYVKARLYVPHAGNYITQFITFLRNYGIPNSNITCAGHSLGAHVCGQVGQNSGGQLGKIIGLDPAGPLFTIPLVTSRFHRLDKSDARQVVVIHSCDGLIGINIPSGHFDFYPNLGLFPQRGCSIQFLTGSNNNYDPITCSHFRAVDIFTKSLVPGKGCKAIKCDSVFSYLQRECNNNQITATLGFLLPRQIGKFFFLTDDSLECKQEFW